MSIEVMRRVWEQSQHRGAALAMLLALADMADDYGYCITTQAALAAKARVSDRNGRILMSRLRKSGEVRIYARGAGGRIREPSVYQITLGLSAEEIAESEALSPIARAAKAKR